MDSYQDLQVTNTEKKNLDRIGDNLMNDNSNLLPINNTNYNINDANNNYDLNSTLDTNYHLNELDTTSSLINDNESNLVSDEEDLNVDKTNLKLDKMEQKLDFILDKINLENSEIESIDNIHDIILFIVLGVFTILVLDAIFKVGFRLGNAN